MNLKRMGTLLVAVVFSSLAALAHAVDVNNATAAELDAVRGIGPGISGKILAERQKGKFTSWQDLVDRVNGVGENNAKKFAQAGLTVNGAGFAGVTVKPPKAAPLLMGKKEAKTSAPVSTAPATTAPVAAPAAATTADAKAQAKADKKAAKEAEKEAKAAEKEKAKAEKEAEKEAKRQEKEKAKAEKEAAKKAKAEEKAKAKAEKAAGQ